MITGVGNNRRPRQLTATRRHPDQRRGIDDRREKGFSHGLLPPSWPKTFQKTWRIERQLAFELDQTLCCRCLQDNIRDFAGAARHLPIPELRTRGQTGKRLKPPVDRRQPRADLVTAGLDLPRLFLASRSGPVRRR